MYLSNTDKWRQVTGGFLETMLTLTGGKEVARQNRLEKYPRRRNSMRKRREISKVRVCLEVKIKCQEIGFLSPDVLAL